MATVEFNVETSQGLVLQAEDELREGNLIPASEKAWDAAARAVKSVAELYGWPHNGHADFFRTVSGIVRLSGDAEIRNLFSAANSLHQNIYEGWLSVEHIAYNIERVKRLLTKLDAFMDAGGNEVKAVAEMRGWRRDTRADLFRAMDNT